MAHLVREGEGYGHVDLGGRNLEAVNFLFTFLCQVLCQLLWLQVSFLFFIQNLKNSIGVFVFNSF